MADDGSVSNFITAGDEYSTAEERERPLASFQMKAGRQVAVGAIL